MAFKKPEHIRLFLSPASDADSYVHLTLHHGNDGGVNFKLSDCDRRVNLWFPNDEAGRRKWQKMKLALERAEAHLFPDIS